MRAIIRAGLAAAADEPTKKGGRTDAAALKGCAGLAAQKSTLAPIWRFQRERTVKVGWDESVLEVNVYA
mgnify:FL=1